MLQSAKSASSISGSAAALSNRVRNQSGISSATPANFQRVASSETVTGNDQHGGVTARVFAFSLLLALFFGYVNPIIDAKLANTFLGAQHLPPGSVGVLIVVLLFINPMTRWASRSAAALPFMLLGAALCVARTVHIWRTSGESVGCWTGPPDSQATSRRCGASSSSLPR